MTDADRTHVDHAPVSDARWSDEPRQGLSPALPPGTVLFAAEDVVRAVARRFGMRISTLKSKSKAAHLAEARDAACWLLRRHSRMGLEQLSAAIGRRDHTTALHAFRRAAQRRATNDWFRETTDDLERKLEEQAKGAAA